MTTQGLLTMSSSKKNRRNTRSDPIAKSEKKNYFYSPYMLAIIVFTIVNVYFTYFQTIDDSEEGIIAVYKSPTCDCCNKWIKHLKSNGFSVRAINEINMGKIKMDKGVPEKFKSCHTAVINGYVIEGHVPANDIIKLLNEKRNVVGLSVPDMPVGSPGMEGSRNDPYKVYEFDQVGNYKVINQY